jgi:hypothetical protein
MIARTGCMDSTSSTTAMIIEPIPASSGLSGEMSNNIIIIILLMMRLFYTQLVKWQQ